MDNPELSYGKGNPVLQKAKQLMKKFFLLLLVIISLSAKVDSQPLSPSAKISLLICAPGDEIYSYFGHAAIRVNDPLFEKDIVFNYGVFSFDTPHFIWRFAKGETDYQLAAYRMVSFMREYQEDHRKVLEYELLLTSTEKAALYAALVENNKPENRVYRYSHFEDNCSTRIRDQIEKAVGGRINYDQSGDEKLSFRNLIDRYVQENSWGGLGIKLALGMPTDRITTFSEKMFLPDYLGNDFAKATVLRDGASVPVLSSSKVLYDAPPVIHEFSVTSPAVVVLLFFFLVTGLTILERKREKRFIWLDMVVFTAFGIASMILCFTTFISVMPSTKWNLNLVWAFPTHLVLAVLWFFPSLRVKLKWYNKLTSIVLILFLASMYFLPQSFHWLVVPLCLILLARTGTAISYAIPAPKM
jgi:hypothetical protein